MNMGIHTNGVLVKTLHHYEIGCFTPNSGQLQQILYGVRYVAVIFLENHSADLVQPFGFRGVKSHGIDQLGQLLFTKGQDLLGSTGMVK